MNTFRVALSSLASLAVFMLLLFWPAGTLHYWQGWAFLGVFAVVSLVPTLFLGRLDPATVERRMHAGPTAEPRPLQKAVVVGIIASFTGMLVVAGLDHRLAGPPCPPPSRCSVMSWWRSGWARRCWWSSRTATPPPTSSSRRDSRLSAPGSMALCAIRCTPPAW
jgi:hypothetical protein